VTIDQLYFVHASPSASVGPSVPVINDSQQETKDFGVRMYSSLMDSFDFMAPIHHIHAISNLSSLSMRPIPFRFSYFNDPWTLTSSTMSYEVLSHIGMEMPLSTTEVVYQSILDTTADPDPSSSQTN
jgi:hypothetical protein